jgi:hypothetical protein
MTPSSLRGVNFEKAHYGSAPVVERGLVYPTSSGPYPEASPCDLIETRSGRVSQATSDN